METERLVGPDTPVRVRPVRWMRRAAAAAVGLLIGVLAVLTFFLVRAVIAEHDDSKHISTLLREAEQRQAQQAAGAKVALDILCKLKRYDLVTGLPALQARLDRASPEYNPARGHTLEGALRLVLSIPSAASCVAHPPASPGSRKHKRPPSLVQEVEASIAGSRHEVFPAFPPRTGSSAPAPRRSSPAPRRRAPAPAPHHRHRHVRPAPRPRAPTPVAPHPSAPVPSPAPPPATTSTTPAPAPEGHAPAPPGHGGEPPPGHGGEPPGQQKKGLLCVEVLHLVKVEVACSGGGELTA